METEVPQLETKDAFHRGRFHLVQPQNCGHRSGIDAMLLASLVPTEFSGLLADLGSGSGGAGYAVASRCLNAQILLVEKLPLMIKFAHKTRDLVENKTFKKRIRILEADVCLKGKERVKAGLLDNHFDFVISNPPFNSSQNKISPDPIKSLAHCMEYNMFQKWLCTAAAILRSNGKLGFIARPESLPDILLALSNRFGSIQVIPVHARKDKAAIRLLISAQKSSRKPLEFKAPLILHGTTGGGFLNKATLVLNGQISVFEA